MGEDAQQIEAQSHFRRFGGFMGSVRLLFDGMILLLVMLIIGFIVFANSIAREPREPAYAADGIVVLTGGVSRIDEATKLLAKRKAKRMLITGVGRETTMDELKTLTTQGEQYFNCCVDIDKEARNTIDNATETAEWVALHRYGSIIIVTSNYHMPRALAELARVLPGVTLIPYAVVDNNVHVERWWTYPGTTKLLLSEYLKYLPALGRLGATNLVRMIVPGDTSTIREGPEP
ncbi:MAG: YdcF family protein [Hyphomicrobiales bacterium]